MEETETCYLYVSVRAHSDRMSMQNLGRNTNTNAFWEWELVRDVECDFAYGRCWAISISIF